MDVRVKATEYELTPEISSYLDDRLAHIEKLLGKKAELARCEVELGRDAGRPRHGKNIFFAAILLNVPGGFELRATNHSESINGAIDDVKEEITRQLRRERQLHRRFARRGGAAMKWLMRTDED